MIYLDTTGIQAFNVGTDQVDKICLGTEQVWPESAAPVYSAMYLTFVIISAGTIVWRAGTNNSTPRTIQYSKDNGNTWTSITSSYNGVSLNVSAGDKVMFKGAGCAESSSNYSGFLTGTAIYNAYGNIMSLIYGDNFIGQTNIQTNYAFYGLFRNNTKLIDASNLILPATTLAQGCYSYLFNHCTSLTTAPSILPATTLAQSCYSYMFEECTSLTTAPELPATTLAESCYFDMFHNCSQLTTAPVLPATTLQRTCYKNMFYLCNNLNYVKCLAKNISAYDCTRDWLNGVSSTGTFVKDANMTSWLSGVSGIPNNWTVVNE